MNTASTLKDLITSPQISANKGITFLKSELEVEFLSYSDLKILSLKCLKNLQSKGMKAGDAVVFQIEDNKRFLTAFWACILGGIIPVPVTIASQPRYQEKLLKILQTLNRPFMIAEKNNLLKELINNVDKNTDLIRFLQKNCLLFHELECDAGYGEIHDVQTRDIAFIQYSSGSTGDPKGVVLTHENLLTNIRAIKKCSASSDTDSFLNWMPLTHDMGLIGFHLSSFFTNINQFIMSPSLFIRKPLFWIKAASDYKVTILSSPNFGYKHLLKFYHPEETYNWDLSQVRLIFNGAEPISLDVIREFSNVMEQYKLKRNVVYPVYGMAEASLGVTFPIPGEDLISYNLDRMSLKMDQEVRFIPETDMAKAITFVDVGYPIDNCAVRIVNKDNKILEDNTIGQIQIKGENVTKGYYNNENATRDVLSEDGWLSTGDLGFLKKGRLIVTGRLKEIIFINGQNFYSHDIEQIAEACLGIHSMNIFACSITNTEDQKDDIAIFIKYNKSLDEFLPLITKLKGYLFQCVGIDIKEILPVKQIPKTTSGKKQRFILKEMFENGEFNDLSRQVHEKMALVAEAGNKRAPETGMEETLLEICKNVTGNNNIGMDNNFFEMGVDSLTGAIIISRINKEMKAELELSDLFENPTLRQLSGKISGTVTLGYSPIPVLSKKEFYETSSSQKRLYVLNRLEGNDTSYNIPGAIWINGRIDAGRIEDLFKSLIRRHEAFRTSFRMVDGEIVQSIHEAVDFNIETQSVGEELEDAELKEIMASFIKPFDLNKAPLLRAKLIKLEADRHLLIIDMHHIISDGTSAGILLEDYTKLLNNKNLPELRIQYKDFAAWQNKMNQSESIKKQESYWTGNFKDGVPVLNITSDFSRPAMQSHEGGTFGFDVNTEYLQGLKKIAQESGTTIYMTLLALLNVLLAKHSGQEDIVIGTPIAGRRHTDLEKTIGMFVNTLAMRNYPSGKLPFRKLLSEVRKNSLNAFENQDYPFEMLVEKLEIQRDLSRNPLFDVFFSLQNFVIPEKKINGICLQPFEFKTGASKFDLMFEMKERNNKLSVNIDYCSKIFKRDRIERMAGHFIRILEQVLVNPDIPLNRIDIVTEDEKENLKAFNLTQEDYPKNKTIDELFKEQVVRTPDHTALTYAGKQISYSKLNEMAGKISQVLKHKGIRPDTVTAVMMDRSPGMIASVLGILMSGGAFMPVDPDYPADRIEYMLRDGDARFLLVRGICQELKFCGEIIDIDRLESISGKDTTDVKPKRNSGDLLYLIYTSGTTGRPKGVMLEHRNMVNLIFHEYQKENVDFMGNVMQFAAQCFDVCYQEIFSTLLCGGNLHIIPEELKRNIPGLCKFISENHISVIFFPTAFLKFLSCEEEFIQLLPGSIEHIIVAGEQLLVNDDLKRYMVKNKVTLHNHYGPSETHVVTTLAIKPDQDIPYIPSIGRPISNTEIFILNEEKLVQPIGIAGELYIGGANVGRGYKNLDEMTREKYETIPELSDNRLYRTGDLARRLPGGNIEFLGRIDHQVKIRGYRIEPGEIETVLIKQEGIKEAVVLALDDNKGGRFLCAYVTSDNKLEIKMIRDSLSKVLPDYMVPSFIVQIDSIPMTSNRKVDMRALPRPEEIAQEGAEFTAPRTATEERMAAIWQEVLGIEKIGITDNFFNLGGDSLKAILILSKIEKNFGIEIELKELFRRQKLSEISSFIDEMSSQPPEKEHRILTNQELSGLKRQNWKILDVKAQTSINTYLHHAFPLSIILADDRFYPWLYENFVQIFAGYLPDNVLNKEYLVVNFIDDSSKYGKLLDMKYINSKDCDKIEDLLQFIIAQIDSGFFVQIYLDEYYIPCKDSYQKSHLIHESMICGYNPVERKFLLMVMDRLSVFGILAVDYDTVIQASKASRTQKTAFWLIDVVILMRLKKEVPPEYLTFKMSNFLDQFERYTHSKLDENKEFLYWSTKNYEAGFKVYDHIIVNLNNLLKGHVTMEYKSIHLLVEHKRLMAERLKFIEKEFSLTGRYSHLVQQYHDFVQELEKARLIILKIASKVSGFDIADDQFSEFEQDIIKTIHYLDQGKQREMLLLTEVYDLLKSKEYTSTLTSEIGRLQ